MKREDGYYWVKYCEEWQIAEWWKDIWMFPGCVLERTDDVLDEIDEHRIERFAEADANTVLGDVWRTSDRPFIDYPIGTKAQAQGGGYWIKNKRGWKWCTGATFPAPGGDWNGMVSLPNCT